jgi:putative flippase GtrA
MFIQEIIRFGVIGVVSNLVLYLVYLELTGFGVGHKSSMTILYVVGALQTFAFNKKWTFSHLGHLSETFRRYVGLYVVGYLINLAVLITAVDWFGFHHQWVQGAVILVLAVFLFLGQKLWVFKPAEATWRSR